MTWRAFFGPNLGYALELYEAYRRDPRAVAPEVAAVFARLGPPPPEEAPAAAAPTVDALARALRAAELCRSIREYGHLRARIDPLATSVPEVDRLDPKTYGLTWEELEALPAAVWPEAPGHLRTAREVVEHLLRVYTGSLAYEFAHVESAEERAWLHRAVEEAQGGELSPEERRALLRRLTEVEVFERFLHRTFPGQKRFSIEGTDALVPMLDALIHAGARAGARHVLIGMAHRGRLNVLAHVLGKPYEAILAEFHTAPDKDLVPSEGSMGINYGWTGDVKYHLGAEKTVHEAEMVEVRLTLANNPSHLEFVNPVVQGFARACQDRRDSGGPPEQDVDAAFAILVHGDASFPGEGIVAETLNLGGLPGYRTGGTVHIIANNRIGFTTGEQEGRSTRYASDLAKGFEIPIVHVCADDPEACLKAAQLAYAYRRQFHKDFLIDLVGYRRWGHNEGDDPTLTQPTLYEQVARHPTVRTLYAAQLQRAGLVTEEEVQAMERAVEERLQQAHRALTEGRAAEHLPGHDRESVPLPPLATAVPADRLRELGEAACAVPAGFTVHPRLVRVLERRREALRTGEGIDWALAEILAFASILADGVPIRLSGQDSKRGTFSQRHLALYDYRTGAEYIPLQHLPQARASFAVHNSPLTEAAVIGFEYGYSVQAPRALVLWEAQYGDFANAGQVLIDQFVASGQAKWRQRSGLVLLLPHGYEGQGPEHSSARLERYLQLSAEDNWQVLNLTTAAQYFHALRRQAQLGDHPLARRPLVILTPKSLLRNPLAFSRLEELAEGAFSPILEDPRAVARPREVRRLILCSGKVGVDLVEALRAQEAQLGAEATAWIAWTRVEQLYPFPEAALTQALHRYPALEEVVWLQEEPRNMGAWSFMEPRLRPLVPGHVRLEYVGRPEHAAPAEGLTELHAADQARILREALSRPMGEKEGSLGARDQGARAGRVHR